MDNEEKLIKKLLNDRNFKEIRSLISTFRITYDKVINVLLSLNDAEVIYCFTKYEFDYLDYYMGSLNNTDKKNYERRNFLMKRVVKLVGGKKELIKKLANNGDFKGISTLIKRYTITTECNITIDEVIETILTLDDARTIYYFMKNVLGVHDDLDRKNHERRHLLIKRVIELMGGKKELIKKLLNTQNFKDINSLISTNEITFGETIEAALSLNDARTIYYFMKYNEERNEIADLLIKRVIELKDYEYILKILTDAITLNLKMSKITSHRMHNCFFYGGLSQICCGDVKGGLKILREASYAMQEECQRNSVLNHYEESILSNLPLLLEALNDCDDLSLLKKYKEKVAIDSVKKYLEELISKLSEIHYKEDFTSLDEPNKSRQLIK